MDLIERQRVDEIIDMLIKNDNLCASPTIWFCLHQIKKLPSVDISDESAYRQGVIEGRVQKETELLAKLKEIVGVEVWANI